MPQFVHVHSSLTRWPRQSVADSLSLLVFGIQSRRGEPHNRCEHGHQLVNNACKSGIEHVANRYGLLQAQVRVNDLVNAFVFLEASPDAGVIDAIFPDLGITSGTSPVLLVGEAYYAAKDQLIQQEQVTSAQWRTCLSLVQS